LGLKVEIMKTNPAFIIQELKSIETILEKNIQNGSLPSIEKDLIKTKLQAVYDSVLNLDVKLNSGEVTSTQKKQSIATPEIVENTIEKQLNDYVEYVSNEVKHENSIKPEIKIESKDEPSVRPIQEHKEILAEKIAIKTKPINEVLSGTLAKKDISSHLQAKGIKDIASAIDINDRFLFVRELFSGDADSFSKTINTINNAANFNDAFNYIHNTYAWDIDSEPAQKLLDLVRRRFIIEE
jgi:hypothetical protein